MLAPLEVTLYVQSNGSRPVTGAADNIVDNNLRAAALMGPVLISGLSFRGQVDLCVNIPSIPNAQSLDLRLEGTEKVDDGDFLLTETFLQLSFPLVSFPPGTPLMKGQYEYPFEATLPYNLCPTLWIRNSTTYSVGYTLKVRLVTRNGNFGGWTYTPLRVLGNSIRSPYFAALIRPYRQTMPVKTAQMRRCCWYCCWCCFRKRGIMSLTGIVARAVYRPGDLVRVGWKAVNHSTIAVNNVCISLLRVLRRNDFVTNTKEVWTSTFPGDQFSELTPRGPGSDSGEDPEAALAHQAFHIAELTIPAHTPESFRGKLFRIDYGVKIQLQTDIGYCSPGVLQYIVVISRASITNEHATSAPDGQENLTVVPEFWSATTAEVTATAGEVTATSAEVTVIAEDDTRPVAMPVAHGIRISDSSSSPHASLAAPDSSCASAAAALPSNQKEPPEDSEDVVRVVWFDEEKKKKKCKDEKVGAAGTNAKGSQQDEITQDVADHLGSRSYEEKM